MKTFDDCCWIDIVTGAQDAQQMWVQSIQQFPVCFLRGHCALLGKSKTNKYFWLTNFKRVRD